LGNELTIGRFLSPNFVLRFFCDYEQSNDPGLLPIILARVEKSGLRFDEFLAMALLDYLGGFND
jgi:hypothetical protein